MTDTCTGPFGVASRAWMALHSLHVLYIVVYTISRREGGKAGQKSFFRPATFCMARLALARQWQAQ